MIGRFIEIVIAFATRRALYVIAVSCALFAFGNAGRRALSHDVLPDLSEPQVVLLAEWMGHKAPDVANHVTAKLTEDLAKIPGVTSVRGSSMSDMAYVDVVFAAGSNLESERAKVLERIAALAPLLPEAVRMRVGPAASATGWVYQYVLIDPTHGQSATSLRRLQDDVVRPALTEVSGVAEVASLGGTPQMATVEAKPNELAAKNLAYVDLVHALPTARERTLTDFEELEVLPVVPFASAKATETTAAVTAPVKVGDVARVRMASEMPTGVADYGAQFRLTIGGIVIARWDADPSAVAERTEKAVAALRPRLPRGVELVTVYDRQGLTSRVGDTLVRALIEEVGVVVFVILLFLLDWQSALIPLLTLPLVLMLTFGAMWLLGMPASIMSLGGIGIALGMAVDADVVALEACHRRMEGADVRDRKARRAQIAAASIQFAPAIVTALLITALSFLPVFAFTGETGRLLRPLAISKTLVVLAAALVALTAGPALRDRLLGGRVVPEFDNPLTRGLVKMYRPLVHFALTRPALTLVTAVLAVASCLPLWSQLGGEFLPRIDEGDLLYMPTTLTGISSDEAANELRRLDHILAQFPEVDTVFGKVGHAETATDPAPLSMIETTLHLKPRSEWPKVSQARWYSQWAPARLRALLGRVWPEERAPTTAELVDKLDRATRVPGWVNAWTTPARGRLDMMSTGVRTPVGVRIFAPNPERLEALGSALRTLTAQVRGARSAVFESLGRETRLVFRPDPDACVTNDVDPALAQSTADLIISGGEVAALVQDGKRYRVTVTPDLGSRGEADQLRQATIRSSPHLGGTTQAIPLALLGRADYAAEPAMLRTERGQLVAYVYVDLAAGTDLLDYVQRARAALEGAVARGEIKLDEGRGERVEWAGQYELMAAGQRRFAIIVPLVLCTMFGLLYLLFGSLTEALLVLLSVPFALVGSTWTLFWLGYPLSAPVWVGLLSVVGLAMQTGVVMVVYIDDAFYHRVREGKLRSREDIVAAHAEGTIRRLRPKVMTITTMGAGLLPLLWAGAKGADAAGAEIMKRVAAPMIGGLATSAFLTLEVLPVLYTIWRTSQLKRAERRGVSIEVVLNRKSAPSWARPKSEGG